MSTGSKFLLICPLLLYAGSGWLIRSAIHRPELTRTDIYSLQLVLFALIVLIFFLGLSLKKLRRINWRFGATALLVAPIITPSVMQTDLYRYIWDGLNLIRGTNPYSIAPIQSPEFAELWWVGLINFPDLPTIYPPVAELFFAAAALINPLFWSADGFTGSQMVTLWQVELGWSIIVGLMLAATVYLLRNRQWYLLMFNPLIIICAVGNKHIEVLLLPFLASFIAGPLIHKNSLKVGCLLGLSIATKWLPVIWLPFIVAKYQLKSASRILFLALSITLLTLLLFSPEVFSSLSTSSKSFANDWYFFSYGFGLFSYFFQQLGIQGDQWPKALSMLFGGSWCLFLLLIQRQASSSVQFYLIWLMLGFYFVIPTLNPWYFLPLLIMGIRHWPVLWSPIIWPATAFISQTYYLGNEMPLTLQSSYYLFISGLLLRDGYTCRHRLFSPEKRLKPIQLELNRT